MKWQVEANDASVRNCGENQTPHLTSIVPTRTELELHAWISSVPLGIDGKVAMS